MTVVVAGSNDRRISLAVHLGLTLMHVFRAGYSLRQSTNSFSRFNRVLFTMVAQGRPQALTSDRSPCRPPNPATLTYPRHQPPSALAHPPHLPPLSQLLPRPHQLPTPLPLPPPPRLHWPPRPPLLPHQHRRRSLLP